MEFLCPLFVLAFVGTIIVLAVKKYREVEEAKQLEHNKDVSETDG